MKTIKTLLSIIIVLSSMSLTAQNAATKKADKHFEKYQFVSAIKAYNKLVEKGKADDYVYKQLAEANYNIFNTKEAERWFAKVLENTDDAETILKYAQMLKANGKYEAFNAQMRKYASMRPSDVRAMAFMENPNYIPEILEKGKKFNIQDAGVNSSKSDFGGMMQNGKLYITSARNDSRKNYGWNEQPFLDIFSLTQLTDGTYQEAQLLNDNINTKYHEGLVAFSPDGNTMYFSRESFYDNLYEKNEQTNTKFSVLNLYRVTKLDDDWGNAEALPFNTNTYSVKNPSISADGSTLYFASDMPGGYGKFDIYKASIAADGTLGEAQNLGAKINTEGQEMFPFISNNEILYFSSDGHLGLGGLDVFHTKMVDGGYTAVRNIGIPINSNADDFAFIFDENTESGFVSSNREGGQGSDDIYAIKKIQPLCDVHIVTTITDKKTGEVLGNAEVTLYDSQSNKIETKTTTADGKVEFLIECDKDTHIEVVKEDYESAREFIAKSDESQVAVSVALDPIEKIIEITPERIVLNPIYFDFDKSNITAQAAFELDKLVQIMNKYPDLVVRAESHTDVRGSRNYNESLSDRRAKSTVQYVISKGIDAARLSGVGFGESRLKVDCRSNCTENDHDLNRRSEFIIVSGGPNQN